MSTSIAVQRAGARAPWWTSRRARPRRPSARAGRRRPGRPASAVAPRPSTVHRARRARRRPRRRTTPRWRRARSRSRWPGRAAARRPRCAASGRSTVDAEGRHHRDGEVDVGLRHEVAVQARPPGPCGMAGPASSRPERNWLETSPRTATSPPASVPPLDLDRQVARRADLVRPSRRAPARRRAPRPSAARACGWRRRPGAGPSPEPGHREQEAARGARQAGVDDGHVADGPAAGAGDGRAGPSAQSASISAPERPQALDHRLGVVGVQRVGERAGAVGQRRAHEGAVGDALRARAA